MKEVSFSEFRKNAALLFDFVERGETVVVTRHGKPIAEVVPVMTAPAAVSWKRTNLALKLDTRGASLSREILRERARDGVRERRPR